MSRIYLGLRRIYHHVVLKQLFPMSWVHSPVRWVLIIYHRKKKGLKNRCKSKKNLKAWDEQLGKEKSAAMENNQVDDAVSSEWKKLWPRRCPVLLNKAMARWDGMPDLTFHQNSGFGIWDFIQWGWGHAQQKEESLAQTAQCIGTHTAYINIHDLLEHTSSWKSTLWIRVFFQIKWDT